MRQLCRELAVSRAIFYEWCSKYSGMDARLMMRMKEPETKNNRLCKMYAEKNFKAKIESKGIPNVGRRGN